MSSCRRSVAGLWSAFGLLAVLLVVTSLASISVALAQVEGSLSGRILDQAGAVVVGAQVRLVNQGTGQAYTVVSGSGGLYQFPFVRPGIYLVSVASPGFKTATAENMTVDMRSNRVLDFQLLVGDIVEEVTVLAPPLAQVDLAGGELSSLIERKQVTELPMISRNFVALGLLVPGASVADDLNLSQTHMYSNAEISYNGNPATSNMWLIDGASNLDFVTGKDLHIYPSVDSIAEFRVQRSNYGAEMPAASGAQISVVTKSGTNQWHGTLYEFHRNAVLNATDFILNRAGQGKQGLVDNDFGYTAGGPILEDRLFFFWSQEWRRERRGLVRQGLVPTLLERRGDFSGPNSIYDDPVDPLTQIPFADNRIPSERLSPAGLAYMGVYPEPTIDLESPLFHGYNWVAAPVTPLATRQETIRIDYHVSKRHSFMLRGTNDTWNNGSPTWLEAGAWLDDIFPPIDSTYLITGVVVSGEWTATLGPSTVNQMRISWSGNRFRKEHGSGQELSDAIVSAIPEIYPGPDGFGHGTIWGDPFGNGTIWHWAPLHGSSDDLVYTDDFSRVFSSHSLKIGLRMNFPGTGNNGDQYADLRPGFSFFSAWWPTTGNEVANLLLKDQPVFSFPESSGVPDMDPRWRDFEFYFSDRWRIHPRLTLTLGLRCSILPEPWEQSGKIGNFVPSLFDPGRGREPTNGMIYPGEMNGLDVDGRALVHQHWGDLTPRFGFAWDPTGSGQWAIRGGAGTFVTRHPFFNDIFRLAMNPPFIEEAVWGDRLRPLDRLPPESELDYSSGLPANGKDIWARIPGSYQWNISIERELTRDIGLEVSYVGNRGHHLSSSVGINEVPPELRREYAIFYNDGNWETDANSLRPYYEIFGSGGPKIARRNLDSYYHALQIQSFKRFTDRYSFQLAYTWSKTLSTGASDPLDLEYDRGPAELDRPHMLAVSSIVKTPLLQSNRTWIHHVLGDWEIAGIYTLNSGTPRTISCCNSFAGFIENRPDQIADAKGPGTVEEFFNTEAFVPPSELGRVGYSSKGQVRGPRINNLDFSLMKNIPGLPWFTGEGASLQLRLELFNALNHTQYKTINTTFPISVTAIDEEAGTLLAYDMTNPNFGRVTNMRWPREIQLGLKVIW